MKKKNVAQSAHSDDVRDHVPDKESRNDQLERLAKKTVLSGFVLGDRVFYWAVFIVQRI